MRNRLLYTILGTAVLSIFILLTVSGGGAAQTDPPATGDWTVSDTTVVSDQTVDLHGDLTITSTGSLTLTNVKLRIFLASNGEYGIEVQAGGSLVIEDSDNLASTTADASVIDAQPNTRSYFFIVRSGTSLRISNSFIYRCGYIGTTGNTQKGLFVGTDDATIEGTTLDDCNQGLILDHAIITVTESTVSNSTYHGIDAIDSDLTLTRVTMADNGYEGANIVRGDALLDGCWVGGNRNGLKIRTGANVTINNTIVKGNNDGLQIQIDGNVIIRGSTFRGQGQYGIHAENRGTLVISDSQLYGATRTALYVFNDITVTSTGNLYRSNIYGARLKMSCTMTSTGDTYSANTNSGIYLESTSDLVIVDGTVRGNSVGVKAEDASTVLAWSTTVEECSFEGYKITDSDLVVQDGEMLNCTGGGIVAPAPSTARWVVNPSNSSRILDSDLHLTRNLIISGDTVIHDSIIVFPDYSYPSYVGVGVDKGQQDWQNVTFRPATSSGAITFTIVAFATGIAWHVTFQGLSSNDNYPGDSPTVDAPFEFHECTFRDSTFGIMVYDSEVVFDRCTFTANDNGASVNGSEVRFENCTFTSNTVTDVTSTNGGHAVLVNSTFTPSMVVPSGPGDTWSAWWTVHVKVKFPTGSAAPGALVVVRDSMGSTIFSGNANVDGFIANIMILEHVTTGTVRDARSPHTFNATLGVSANEGTTDVTGHGLVTIEIADGSPPSISITSHTDGDHITTPVLTLQGTAVDAGSSIYRVEARIATQAWQTCSGTDAWEWVTSLPGDGTYPISVRARDIALNEMTIYINLTLDTLAPTIDVSVPPSPSNNSLVGTESVTIVGWVDASDVVVTSGAVTADMEGTAFTLNLTLASGLNKVIIRAEDPAGNVAILEWWLQADLDAPTLNILSPLNNSRHNTTTITLTGTTDPFVDVYYKVNQLSTVWSMLTVSGSGGFSKDLTDLQQGANTLEVMVRDAASNEFIVIIELYVDTVPPRLEGTSPNDNANVNYPTLTVTGWYNEPLSSLMIGDNTAVLDGGNFTVVLDLVNGLNQFTVVAKDEMDNVAISTFRIFLDRVPPGLDIPGFTFDPDTGNYKAFSTNQKRYLLFGNTELGALVYVDRWEQIVDSLGRFTASLDLEEGVNLLPVLVRDKAGNEYHTNVTLVLDTYSPQLTVSSPKHMSTVEHDFVWVTGTVTEGDTVTVGEVEMVSDDGTFSLKVALDQAVNRIVVVAVDDAGNEVSVERVVFQGKDTSGLTGNPTLDQNCNSILVLMVIVLIALGILLSFAWKEENQVDRREKALESLMEEDHIELDKPHLEPSSGYLQYDPTSPTGRKNEFEEKEDEEFISMDSFRREMENREP
jgi:hypothetical protein